MSKLKVYLAGPIAGQTADGLSNSISEKVAILTDLGYLVYNPMIAKDNLIQKADVFTPFGYEALPVATEHAIFARDKWMVQQSDIVIADLTSSGSRVSIGTMMEIAWANLQGKMVIVILPRDNIHDHLFVHEAATHIFQSLDDVYDYLGELSTALTTWRMP